MTEGSPGERLSWTAAGIAAGARLAVPAMPVMALFSAAFGAFAAQKGLSLVEAALMSTLMFAGASQFVAAEIWAHPMTAAVIVTLVVVTATVNLRFFLIGASLRPWLGSLPAWRIYPALAVLTEPGWLLALRYRAEGGSDAAILLGSGFVLWLVWIAGTVGGYLVGSLVAEPQRYGLDLIMPVFFIVLLVPMWRGARAAVPWVAAGAAALLAAWFLPGSWYIIVGAVAGAIAGGLQDERA
jgi:4-azaleucine resistance transporter AzlC